MTMMRKREARGAGAVVLALAAVWAGTASAAPSSDSEAQVEAGTPAGDAVAQVAAGTPAADVAGTPPVTAGTPTAAAAGPSQAAAGTPAADAAGTPSVEGMPAVAAGTLAVADAPLELDSVAFQGETQANRAPDAPLNPAAVGGEAQTTPPRSDVNAEPGKRLNALVLLSAADGVGGGAQLRNGVFGVRGTLSYRPLFFLVDADPGDNKFGAYQFANSVQLNVDVMLAGVESERGGSIGYRFNNLMGNGFTIAYQSAFDAFGQHFNLSFPVTYYPEATGRVRDRLGIASGHEINFPFGAGFQFGMGAAWVL